MARRSKAPKATIARRKVRLELGLLRTFEKEIGRELGKKRTSYKKIAFYEAAARKATRRLATARRTVRHYQAKAKAARAAEVPETTGTAIEFKLDYVSETMDPGHAFHANVRITKVGGARMTGKEAKWVSEQFLARRGLPSGYEITALDWESGIALDKRGRSTGKPKWSGRKPEVTSQLRRVLGEVQLDMTPGLVEEG
jgi:hypothetical protein